MNLNPDIPLTDRDFLCSAHELVELILVALTGIEPVSQP